MLRKYFYNILIGIDQLANCFLGGDPDETLSSRAHKAARAHTGVFWRSLAYLLEFIDPGHGERTVEEDEGDDAVWRALAQHHEFLAKTIEHGPDNSPCEILRNSIHDHHVRWAKLLRDTHVDPPSLHRKGVRYETM